MQYKNLREEEAMACACIHSVKRHFASNNREGRFENIKHGIISQF